jgi:hypothetical protein
MFRQDTAGQGYPYKPNRVDGLLLLVRGVSTRLNLRSEVLGLYESEETWESLAFENANYEFNGYYSTLE